MAKQSAAMQQASDEAGESSTTDTNQATVRVLRVLSEFTMVTTPLGVTEVAERLGMSKNMAFRALSTLIDQGYLVRTPSGREYELGFRTIDLSNPDDVEPDLRTLSASAMGRLMEISGETVVLALRVGNLIVMLDGVEPNSPVRSRAPVGSMFPLHASPASRVVLAHLPDDAIEAYFKAKAPLVRITSTTLTDPAQLRVDIRKIREQGFAFGYGDASEGRRSVAFAILDAEGTPWGAISIGGPHERLTEEKLVELVPRMKECMAELNEQTSLFVAPAMPSWVY